TWTAGSLLHADAALGGDEATCAVFSGDRLPTGLDPDCCQ
ncbi:prenyltransferase, partial [Streptomyces phaeochromogenes]